jgi:hypothetical protein
VASAQVMRIRQFLWFVGIWAASVAALALIAFVLRAWLR